MRIIHIEDFFLSDTGYQINIIPKYQVIQGHEVYIVTSNTVGMKKPALEFFGEQNIEERDMLYQKQTGVQIIRVEPLTKKIISGRIIQNIKLFKIVEDLKPDIVYIHGNDTLTGIRFLLRINKLKYPIIMDSHMLSMASKNPFHKIFRTLYKLFITPKIINNKIQIIRTQNDSYVQTELGIPLEQAPWISVGSDTSLFYPDEQIRKIFRKENNIDNDDFVVLYTGKLDSAKGGLLLAEAFLEKFKNKKSKNIVLIVVGKTIGNYGAKVEELFSNSKNKIIRFPTQKYTDLPKFYQAADLSVFPKQCSLSFYDAQACGLPVIAEDNNINIDRLKHGNGFTFKADDVKDFRDKILKCIEMDEQDYKKMRDNAYKFVKEYYDYMNIAKQYTSILENECRKYWGNK